MNKLCIFVFLFICSNVFAQNRKANFDHTVMTAEGDLNKDGIKDVVIVMQDTLQESAPYRIQVFFRDAQKELQLITSSTKLIEAQYPDGREWRSGNGFSDVKIEKGVLLVEFSLVRGQFTHKFRYQNGNFELIGYTYSSSDGIGKIYSTDYNLSTGVKISKVVSYETDEVFSNTKTKKLIRPLPKLQDVVPFENDDY